MMPGVRRALIVCFAGLLLGACSSQRPLPVVLDSGDKAAAAGNYHKAAADYQEYVDRNPGEPTTRHKLARAYLETGDSSRAVKHAQVAYDNDPMNPLYIETLAEALYESGQTQELFTFLQNLAKDRRGVNDYIRLGLYSARAGYPDEARQAFLTAARFDRGRSVGPQLALADFYESLNDRENAIVRLRYALYIDPKNPEVQARIRALGEVPGPAFALPPEEAN